MTHAVSVTTPSDHRSDRNHHCPAGSTYIYFMGTEDGLEVKLGKTRQHAAIRRKQHEISNGRREPMRTLAVVLGVPSDEKALKRYFKPYTSREHSGEWIRAGVVMRDYLRFLRDLPFVARSEEREELARLSVMPSHEWLPNEGRRKAAAQLSLAEDDPWHDIYTPEPGDGDFYTHRRLIEPARHTMGVINLDPASCREANEIVQAERFFNAAENGLLQEWQGNVWLNPPFGLWAGWTAKALSEWRSGRVSQMCLLLSTRSLTDKGVHPLVTECDALMVSYGRIPFWGPKATPSPDDGHVVMYFGPKVREFADAYRQVGTVKFKNCEVAA